MSHFRHLRHRLVVSQKKSILVPSRIYSRSHCLVIWSGRFIQKNCTRAGTGAMTIRRNMQEVCGSCRKNCCETGGIVNGLLKYILTKTDVCLSSKLPTRSLSLHLYWQHPLFSVCKCSANLEKNLTYDIFYHILTVEFEFLLLKKAPFSPKKSPHCSFHRFGSSTDPSTPTQSRRAKGSRASWESASRAPIAPCLK